MQRLEERDLVDRAREDHHLGCSFLPGNRRRACQRVVREIEVEQADIRPASRCHRDRVGRVEALSGEGEAATRDGIADSRAHSFVWGRHQHSDRPLVRLEGGFHQGEEWIRALTVL